MSKTIAFFSNQLGLRGTEIRLYNYARYNEEVLGNKSIIVSQARTNQDAVGKFKARFEVNLINSYSELEPVCKKNKADYFYITKAGNDDGWWLRGIPTIVHVVFRVNKPHGHKYIYISDWLAKDQGYSPETHALSHIVEKPPAADYSLREQLNIPTDATVFGCYGGLTEFNIRFVQEAVIDTVSKNKNIYFILMNINKFGADHDQIKHLPGTYDLNQKAAFVEATNAMIHARKGGETFGMAVAEFSISNKPVLTYADSGERAHIELLGDRGIYYRNKAEVSDIFTNLSKYIKHDDYYKCYNQFTPRNIMTKFNSLLDYE